MEKLTTAGIIGYGQVGKSLAKFYEQPKIKDINQDDGLKGVDVLNICIPYNENFVKIVKEEIDKIKPKLTIIHSTVAPGTTKEIGGMIVHSPIRGVHPHLYRGIKYFTKYIGADMLEAGVMAEDHIRSLGIKPKAFGPSITTELGKLLSTSYYGICIAWANEMNKYCDMAKVDFKEVVTHFNKTYNEGYNKLDMPNFNRPLLHAPDNDKIGGHCIISNAKILQNYRESEIIKLLLKYDK